MLQYTYACLTNHLNFIHMYANFVVKSCCVNYIYVYKINILIMKLSLQKF